MSSLSPRFFLRSAALATAWILAAACGSGDSEVTPTPEGTDDADSGTSNSSSSSSSSSGSVATGKDDASTDAAPPSGPIKTVFIILMENTSWQGIMDSASSKYIKSLLPWGGHAEQMFTPPKLHPSEPNYIWLEAGDNLGIDNDDPPAKNHRSTKDHLTAQLEGKGIDWKAYSEDTQGDVCPLTKQGSFDPKHTPQLFFDDVTDTNNPASAHCKAHVRPYSELAADLANNKVGRYNFITPNLCHDMHGEIGLSCPPLITDMIKHGDEWLAEEVPKILASSAYKDNGVIFLTWDEGDERLFSEATDGPIGMIVLSPLAKKGFSTSTKFTHSSTFKTLQRIFDVPFLAGAKTSNDLSEMFVSFP